MVLACAARLADKQAATDRNRYSRANSVAPGLNGVHVKQSALDSPATRSGCQCSAGLSRWLPLLAVAALATPMVSLLAFFEPGHLLSGEDSWAPMHAALGILTGPHEQLLYEILFFQDQTKFQYPPTSLLPLMYLDQAGLGTPYLLNRLNVALVSVMMACMAGLADRLIARPLEYATGRRLILSGAAAASVLAYYPVLRAVQLGQIQIWIDVAVTAACLLGAYGRCYATGALMGLASMLKPQFLPLLLIAASKRSWRFSAAFAAVLSVAGAMSVWRYGVHDHLAYLTVLQFIGQHGETSSANNSVNGILNRWLDNGNNLNWEAHDFSPFNPFVYAVTLLTSVAFLALPFIIQPGRSNAASTLLHAGLCLACVVLASPIAWEHHYGVLPPIFVIVLADCVVQPLTTSRRCLVLLALTLSWTLCASDLSPIVNQLSGTVLNPLQATHFMGALILIALISALLKGKPSLTRELTAREAREMIRHQSMVGQSQIR